MKTLLVALALGSASIARAEGSEVSAGQSDLTCVGLMRIAVNGAMASKPQVPEVMLATTAAYSLYVGRLSRSDPSATRETIAKAVDQLTLEEKNVQVNACMKKAAEIMRPHMR